MSLLSIFGTLKFFCVTCSLTFSSSFLILIQYCHSHLPVCLSFNVHQLSFSLLLWWKQPCMECLIPRGIRKSCCVLCHTPVGQKKASFMLVSATNYLCILLSRWSLLHRPRSHSHSSRHLLFFVCLPSLSLPHFISLHPILCMWVEGSDSVQTRLFLWRLQHHLSLRGERGHPWQPAHRWWYSHYWPDGKIMIPVEY